jgi:hypothetical protein
MAMAFSSGTVQGMPHSARGRTRFSVARVSAGKALHMNHHAWASKELIVLVALALAFAPALKAAESSRRVHLDGKTGGIERVSARPASLDDNSGAQEAAAQSSPQASPTGAAPATVKAPQVTYEDGQLTVIAENSSLSEVMKALRAALGADIDLPGGVADQHIWVHLGPGPARRVLRDLLDGTEFNYVMQASDSDPDGIRSVLLTARSKSAGPGTAAPERTAMRKMPGAGSDAASPTDSENPTPEPVASVDPSQAASPASPGNGLPASAANESAQSASLQNTLGNVGSSALRPPSPTNSDQQIQQLQSMYEQRRQIQIQQNQKAAGRN